MFQKMSTALSGTKWTIVSGVFLAFSLALLLMGKKPPFNPAWITVVLSGYPLLYLAISRLLYEKWISSALLISIAMIASIAIGEMFAAGEVAFIMAIGAILEEKTVERAKKGLKDLISLTPARGRRLLLDAEKPREEMVPVDQIQKGDLLRVLPGEAIPVDGEITAGHTSVDQSILTGESLPQDKGPGDGVYCGTINRFGTIDVTATYVGEDSSLQKLIRLVKEAEEKKAPMQRVADQWATWLVPVALLISIITFAATGDFTRGVTILVVFCPCALALATPTSIMAAIGQATKHGIIIKSGEALEKMGQVDCIAFDKTGTLTNGNLVVTDCYPLRQEISEEALLTLAASAEAFSEHPLAKAMVAFAKEKQIIIQPVTDFQMFPGKGITAVLQHKALTCGTLSFLEERNIEVEEKAHIVLDTFRRQGKATILIAVEASLVGILSFSDSLRDTASAIVKELHTMHTKVVLLTGDHVQAALFFAKQAGIAAVKAELLPEDKVLCISQLEEEGQKVCMIGDGVNDAPALKVAHVGIAMGAMGSDIAVDAADIALVTDDISKIPYLKRLSNATRNTIKFNIALSMAINFIAIILSILGVLNPITGALVHNAGSVLVVCNAALLYDRRFL